jgi:hypothetical protein
VETGATVKENWFIHDWVQFAQFTYRNEDKKPLVKPLNPHREQFWEPPNDS